MMLPESGFLSTFIGSLLFGTAAGAVGTDLYRVLTHKTPTAEQVLGAHASEREKIMRREQEDLERRIKRLDTESLQTVGRQVPRRSVKALRLGRLTEDLLDGGLD